MINYANIHIYIAGMANVDFELVEFYNNSFIDSQRSMTLSPLRPTK